MKYTATIVSLTIAATLTANAAAETVRGAAQSPVNKTETRDLRPNGKGRGHRDAHAPVRRTAGSNGIAYHGGPVMLGTTHIYYIWYGNWAGAPAQSILSDFASNIGGSRYLNINTTYYNGSGSRVSKYVTYRGSASDNYSKGAALDDAGVGAVVNAAITSGRLPKDSNGIYFVLTSKDVKETSGFCTQYCGWHTRATIAGTDIKYAFVGNPAQQCPSACEQQTDRSPNGDAGADGMASIIAHELSESVTDPDMTAWYDTAGEENADKCAWTFGAMRTASNGSQYNVALGSRQYLIQQNWVNASGGYCALSY